MTTPTIAVRKDGRSRHASQAYDVTYAGKSPETGQDGYGSRLSATYDANFQLTIPVDKVGQFTYILPPFIFATHYVVAEGAGGAPAANLRIENLDGSDGAALAAALALASPSAAPIPFDGGKKISVEPYDQRLVINVTAPGTGFATLLVKAAIIQTGWK